MLSMKRSSAKNVKPVSAGGMTAAVGASNNIAVQKIAEHNNRALHTACRFHIALGLKKGGNCGASRPGSQVTRRGRRSSSMAKIA